jgi:hypothetical protein
MNTQDYRFENLVIAFVITGIILIVALIVVSILFNSKYYKEMNKQYIEELKAKHGDDWHKHYQTVLEREEWYNK